MSHGDVRARYVVVPLAQHHDRGAFHCGVDALDGYLTRQASQDARHRVAIVFVAEESASGLIHGFYTLSMAAVLLDKLPTATANKMPRYPSVPAVRLGRLAVHVDAQGTGLGAHLLTDAMARSLQSEVAWAAMLVDAKVDVACSFYTKYGFSALLDDAHHQYLMRATIEPLFV